MAFLKSATHRDIDAEPAFAWLAKERERELRDRFDFWIDGGTRDNYFHGWPNHPEHNDCFTFKWNEKGKCHRLYGFLTHPTPATNPGFQVCVLVSHAMKTTQETDPRELDRAKRLSGNPLVVEAVGREFPEQPRGARQWVN